MASASASRKPVKRTGIGLWHVVLAIVGVLAVLTIAAIFGVLPVLVKERCIAAAAAQGVTLSIDHVAVGPGDVRLLSVTFTLDGVPQINARADGIQIGLLGPTPQPASIDGLAVTIDGPLQDVQKAVDAWNTARAARTPSWSADSQHPVTWAIGHVTWTHPFGESSAMDITDLSGAADPTKGTSHLSSDHVMLTAGKATLGPWGLTVDRDAQTARADLALDPVVQGGPSVLYVRDASQASSLKVTVKASPLSQLGLPPKSVGLGGDSTVEANLDFEEAPTGAATLKGTVGMTHAVFAGAPIDATLTLSAAGNTGKELDVKQGTLVAGPLRASVWGTVKLYDDGARLAMTWRSTPTPCAEIGKQMATQALGTLGTQIGAALDNLGGAVGVKVAGVASASGVITLDSRDVGAAAFTLTTNDTCGIALF